MGLDVAGLIEIMRRDAAFEQIVNNPMTQFGTPTRPLLGATLLPAKTVKLNSYTESGIKYRSPVANDGTRYSAVQIKGGMITGSFKVEVGYSDIGSIMDGQDIDALIDLVHDSVGDATNLDSLSMQAMAQVTGWAHAMLVSPLDDRNEIQRWQAIVDASIVRVGDDNYTETVAISNPAGHRIPASVQWSDDLEDPYDDIITQAEFMKAKGYTINRIITSTNVLAILTLNAIMRSRIGVLSIAGGIVAGLLARLDLTALNALFARDGLPPIEVYDAQYHTATGSDYFLDRDVFVMVATTGRTEILNPIDDEPLLLDNVLGYTAIGTPSGLRAPGRKIIVEYFERKPERLEGESWQASFPVIQDPEAISVIHTIT